MEKFYVLVYEKGTNKIISTNSFCSKSITEVRLNTDRIYSIEYYDTVIYKKQEYKDLIKMLVQQF